MSTEEIIHELAVNARAAAAKMRAFPTDRKNAALLAIAEALDAMKPQIDAANAEDVAAAHLLYFQTCRRVRGVRGKHQA